MFDRRPDRRRVVGERGAGRGLGGATPAAACGGAAPAATAGDAAAAAYPGRDYFDVWLGRACDGDGPIPYKGVIAFIDQGPGRPGNGKSNDDYIELMDTCQNKHGVKGWALGRRQAQRVEVQRQGPRQEGDLGSLRQPEGSALRRPEDLPSRWQRRQSPRPLRIVLAVDRWLTGRREARLRLPLAIAAPPRAKRQPAGRAHTASRMFKATAARRQSSMPRELGAPRAPHGTRARCRQRRR